MYGILIRHFCENGIISWRIHLFLFRKYHNKLTLNSSILNNTTKNFAVDNIRRALLTLLYRISLLPRLFFYTRMLQRQRYESIIQIPMEQCHVDIRMHFLQDPPHYKKNSSQKISLNICDLEEDSKTLAEISTTL